MRHSAPLGSHAQTLSKVSAVPLEKSAEPPAREEDVEQRQSQFSYTPLEPDTIRLLAPSTSSQADGHAWELRVVRIDDQDIQFDALSYTWGSMQKQYPVTINGKRFLVHANLYSALPYLAKRRDFEKRSGIWIDAICINQSDEDEKSRQITLMSKIYRQAQRVWAWLGIADNQERIPEAIVALEHIGEVAGNVSSGMSKKSFVDFRELKKKFQRRLWTSPRMVNLDHKTWSAIAHILHNSWFQRVWIVQEAALAQNITFFCGKYEINSKMIQRANIPVFLRGMHNAQSTQADIGIDPSHGLAVFELRKIAQRKQDKSGSILMDISYWMAAAENECSLPEDRVRGIEGFCVDQDLLASFQTHTGIVDLYTKFSVELIVRNYARNMFWKWLGLAFTHIRLDGLPSWVPDFHHQARQYRCRPRSIAHSGTGTMHEYKASTRINSAKKGERWNEMVVEGIVLDTISFVLPERSRGTLEDGSRIPVLQQLIILAEWEERVAQAVWHRHLGQGYTHHHQMDEGHLRMDTYWRTLIGNITETNTGSITVDTYLGFQACMRRVLRFSRRNTDPQDTSSGVHSSEVELLEDIARSYTETVKVFKTLLRPLWGRQLFLTEEGRFGFTLRGVRVGDHVCVLNGAPTPHVLRTASQVDERERWSFVGDAYVHGVMYGEVDTMGLDQREIVLV
ncbi:heterokaryon incompatibility protein-domain-containing protein [Paraphoma chrysanthemicola]|uniref:Heterokaryon incompatibility protein-domain-containing protein n=1 Tax=Paraphoma chrysanthemicola TaxID=798071 RepID=A0A8K0R505_9PLEO|nr:heterokaryon incompatibility protein-domain-containing protein [Paraphoma chrysanthemicola]